MRKNVISSRAGAKERPANTSNTLAECDSIQPQTVEPPQNETLASVAGSGNRANSAAPPSVDKPNPTQVRVDEPNIGQAMPTDEMGAEPNPGAPQTRDSSQRVTGEALSPEQQKRKADLEKIIDEGLPTWLDVCCAMAEIKAGGLYHPCETFHQYCRERWHLAKSTCYAYANAGHAFQLIQSSGEDCLPRNEAQLRPLLDLEDEQVTRVWSDAVKLGGTGGLTESIVRKAREMLIGKPVPNFDPIEQAGILKKSIRDAWDKYPAGERPNLIDELTSFTSALGEELRGDSQQSHYGGNKNGEPTKSDLDHLVETCETLVPLATQMALERGNKQKLLGALDCLKRSVDAFLKEQSAPAPAEVFLDQWCKECELIPKTATAIAKLGDTEREVVIEQLVELSRAAEGLASDLIQSKWGRVRANYEVHMALIGDYVVRRALAEHYKTEYIGNWAEGGGYFSESQRLPLFGICDKVAKALPSEKEFPAILEAWVKSETRTLPYRTGKSLQTAKPGEAVNWLEVIKTYGKEAEELLREYVSDLGPYESAEGQPTEGSDRDAWQDRNQPIKLLKALPTIDEFKQLLRREFTLPLADQVEKAMESLRDYKDDLQYQNDEDGEQAQEGEPHTERERKIEDIDSINDPNIPVELGDAIMVYCLRKESLISDCKNRLKACIKAVATTNGQFDSQLVEALKRTLEDTLAGVEDIGSY